MNLFETNIYSNHMNSLMFRYDNDSDYSEEDDDSEFEESKSLDSGELMCRNIDPALARLMGIIIIEEQKQEITWKPRTKTRNYLETTRETRFR